MTQNPNRIPVAYEHDETEDIVIATKEAMGGIAITRVTLEGSRKKGGSLSDIETGEPLVMLAGLEASQAE